MISPAPPELDLISVTGQSRRENASKYDEDDEIIFGKDDEPEMYRALGIRRLRDRRDYSKYDRWSICLPNVIYLAISCTKIMG